MLMDVLQESAEYFAGHLLAPEALVSAYIESGGTEDDFAETFVMPEQIARGRFEEATAAIH
jgi:hypothetical protein